MFYPSPFVLFDIFLYLIIMLKEFIPFPFWLMTWDNSAMSGLLAKNRMAIEYNLEKLLI